jgi:hypothetical protein
LRPAQERLTARADKLSSECVVATRSSDTLSFIRNNLIGTFR